MTAYNNATDRTNVFNQTDLTYLASTGAIRHTLLVGAELGRQLTDNFRNTGFFNNTATSITVPLSATMITTPVTFRQSATDADNHLTTGLGAVYAQDQVALNAARAGRRRPALRSFRSRLSQQPRQQHAGAPRQSGLAARRRRLQADCAAVALRQLQRVVPAELRRSVLVADDDHAAGRAGAVQQLRGRREVGCGAVAGADDGAVSPGPDEHAVNRSERSDADHPDRQPAHQRLRIRRQRHGDASLEHRRRLRLPERLRHERHDQRRGRRPGRAGAAQHVVAVEQLPRHARRCRLASACCTARTCSWRWTTP